MSDNTWRRKSFYSKRILIPVEDVLNPPFQEGFVCLTGAQVNIMRNMLKYAHRRSTFVSEYHDAYYLAPDNDEWDAIEAIVADLEEALMGCSEIASWLECICNAIKSLELQVDIPQSLLDTGKQVYDDYTSPVEQGVGDPPQGWASWDDWEVQKCISAQKFVDEMLASMESLAQVAMIGTGVTGILVYAQLVYSAAAFFPPLAIVMTIAAGIALYGLSALQTEARAWVTEHKEAMVCLIFNADNAGQAYFDLGEYIDDEWDVAGSAFFVQNFVNFVSLSKIFDGDAPGYDDWKGDYSAAYCEACEEEDIVVGSNWYARGVSGEEWIQYTGGDIDWTFDYPVSAGEVCCGFVYLREGASGSSRDKVMWPLSVPSGYAAITTDCSGFHDLGQRAYVVSTNVDQLEVYETLCGSTQHLQTSCPRRAVGQTIARGRITSEWGGALTVTMQYFVFEGSPPA